MYDGPCSLSKDDAKRAYAEFLRDTPRFQRAIDRVFAEWPLSCEHFLTNEKINRVAWLGQAAMCIETGINRTHRAGFMLLTEDERAEANETAAAAIWLWANRRADIQLLQDMAAARLSGGNTGRVPGRAGGGSAGSILAGNCDGVTAERHADDGARV